MLTLTPTVNFRVSSLFVVGQWEEARVRRERPRRHGENMQTLHRLALPQLDLEPKTLLWGKSATHCTAVLPMKMLREPFFKAYGSNKVAEGPVNKW